MEAFCKHTHIKFTEFGFIYSAQIEAYLLEKSRLVHLGQNERNYHIFYQVLAAIEAGDNRLRKYALESVDPTHFKILGNGPFDIEHFNGEPVTKVVGDKSGRSRSSKMSGTGIILAALAADAFDDADEQHAEAVMRMSRISSFVVDEHEETAVGVVISEPIEELVAEEHGERFVGTMIAEHELIGEG